MATMKPGIPISVCLTALLLSALAVALDGPPATRGQGTEPSLEIARGLLVVQRFDEAEAMGAELLSRAEKRHGKESLSAAGVLDFLAEVAVSTGRSGGSGLAFAERAVRIRERSQGSDHPDLGTSLHGKARILREMGEYEAGIEIERRALEILAQHFGPTSAEAAASLHWLGMLYRDNGESEAALASFRDALSIREDRLGPDHPDVAQTLVQVGSLLPTEDDRTERYLQRAREIRLKQLGADSAPYGESLWALGYFYANKGLPVRSEQYYDRALSVYEEAVGLEHPSVASLLNNLGNARWKMGDLAGARQCYERSMRMRERINGPDHPRLATPLTNLGELYGEIGRYELGVSYLERAINIQRQKVSARHPGVAVTLGNLGVVLRRQGKLEEALRVHRQALALRESMPDMHVTRPEIAKSLGHIAAVLIDLEQYVAAREHLERALALQIEAGIEDSEDTGITRMLLGQVTAALGNPKRAVQLLREAVTIFDGAAGHGHDLVRAEALLAVAYRLKGNLVAALDHAVKAESLARRQFREATRVFSEAEALRYGTLRESGLDLALALIDPAVTPSPVPAARRVLDQVVQSRALVMDEMASRHSRHLAGASRQITDLIRRLEVAREDLSRVLLEATPGADRVRRVAEARQAVEGVERRLGEVSKTFRTRLARFSIGVEQVADELPREAALVSIVRYRAPRPQGERYVAFVLRGGGSEPVVLSVGPAEYIDDLVRSWKREVSEPPPPFPGAAREAEERYRQAGLAVRRNLWDPIAAQLGDKRLVLVVPDGLLHLLNLSTLPLDDGRYIAEAGPSIHYLSAERDIPTVSRNRSHGKGLLVLGDPEFGEVEDAELIWSRGGSEIRDSCERATTGGFAPLPGARALAREITALWKEYDAPGEATLLSGRDATELALKRLAPDHRVLHISTHGFFPPEHCFSLLRARGRGSGASSKLAPVAERENPLMLSGLALAGANRVDDSKSLAGSEDGLLTALEIASLDLSRVDWVVLSACKTGVGQVQVGEGVLGLRRAFEIAGAGTLIMSLWEVKDQAAREWMRRLYSARLAGHSTPDAVELASRSTIDYRRQNGLGTHPFHWGAFVAAGDWR